MKNDMRCGYAAIIGRPNVGKSTLLNRLLGKKISITSHKAQTTRHRILGIKTQQNIQTIYVDTPGFYKKTKKTMNRLMNRTIKNVIYDVNIIIFMADARKWTTEDDLILSELKSVQCPIILALNKIDLLKEKDKILPIIDKLSQKNVFSEIVPLSVTKDSNVDVLENLVHKKLPIGNHLFQDDQITDRDDKFLVSEIIREKIMRVIHQEIPYSVGVVIDSMETKKDILHIDATIWVERKGQKIVIIGKKGEKLKEIGRQARLDLEKLFGQKVFLSLWVKIKEDWTNDINALNQFGIIDR